MVPRLEPPASSEPDLDPAAGEVAEGIPAWLGTLLLAGLAVAVAVLPFVADAAAALRLFDLPLNLLLFAAATWLAVRARRRVGLALAGLLLTGLGAAVSVLALVLDRTHPWR